MKFTDRVYFYDNIYREGQMKISVGEILQVSESSVVHGNHISEHKQVCDEISYIISGNGYFVSDGESAPIKAGEIHYIKKGSTHYIKAGDKENLRYMCIGYLPDMSNEINIKLYAEIGDKKNFIISDDGNIKALSELLIRELYTWDDQSKGAVDRYISQIIVTLYRILHGEKGSLQGEFLGEKSSNSVMYNLLRHIDREYIRIKTVKEIADELSYNENYISHLFKEKMGVTVKEYLMKKKISYAGELLKTSNLSVEDVSDALNFSSSHSFRRAFKQYMGCTPSEYK